MMPRRRRRCDRKLASRRGLDRLGSSLLAQNCLTGGYNVQLETDARL